MAIGPLEVLVVGCPGKRFAQEILPELSAIQKQGLIEVVDLIFVRKKADNTVVALEVNDLDDEERAAFDPIIQESLTGAITHEDIVRLSSSLPPETSATIVLLEHLWLGRLEQAVARAEGTIHVGGMISPAAIEQLEQELTTVRSQGQQSGQ